MWGRMCPKALFNAKQWWLRNKEFVVVPDNAGYMPLARQRDKHQLLVSARAFIERKRQVMRDKNTHATSQMSTRAAAVCYAVSEISNQDGYENDPELEIIHQRKYENEPVAEISHQNAQR
ncbi:hypothetical protein CBL_10565 [Carabus blaptoides fortunei]